MSVTRRWLLVAGLFALTTACAPHAAPSAHAGLPETIYVALAERLLQWAGAKRGVFEARPSLAGLDSLEIAQDLAYVAREAPGLNPALLAAIRESVRDTSCLPLPSNWRAHRLRLDTVCGRPVKYPVAERARESRTTALGSSAIAFSPDSSQALVVGMIVCGDLCAHAAYYVFGRTENGWRVADVVVIGES